MSALPAVEQACFWLAGRPPRIEAPPLAGRIEADLAIVGGGFTGLWTALFLKELEPRTEVVLLEAETCAYGASGRNAGIVGETLDHSHALAIRHFGFAEARRMAEIGRRNLDELEDFVAERGIDAQFERRGQLIFALRDEHLSALSDDMALAERLGVDSYRLLDAEEAQAEIHSSLYRGALLLPRGATVEPVRLAEGLRREAERRGVKVYEHSAVTSFDVNGTGVRAFTSGGEVAARRAVLATNAYSLQLLPRLGHRYLPLYDYVMVSQPLSSTQKDALGWRQRRGATDARAFFNYYRLTADDRVLWGTSEAVYYPGNRADRGCDHSPRHYQGLRESFAQHFPQLGDLEFPYAWGGPICSTTRLTPFFGRAYGGRLLYGLGYTGHGIASTRLAGRILAHLALEKPSPLLDLAMVRRAPLPFPPEPLRHWAISAVERGLRRTDQGQPASLLLRLLDALGIGFSS
ncbi:MAG: FAD-dependent oxidoreductase [Acidobacteriota bacterium]